MEEKNKILREKKFVFRVIADMKPVTSLFLGSMLFWGNSLTFTKNRLDITYSGLVRLSFLKEDVISIEVYQPEYDMNWKWIKINHKIKDYPEHLVFKSPFKSAENLLKEIEATGFLDKNISDIDNSTREIIRKKQKGLYVPDYFVILVSILILVITIGVIISFL